jgi:hypothetical protein
VSGPGAGIEGHWSRFDVTVGRRPAPAVRPMLAFVGSAPTLGLPHMGKEAVR